jgi:hypothetical protein
VFAVLRLGRPGADGGRFKVRVVFFLHQAKWKGRRQCTGGRKNNTKMNMINRMKRRIFI